MQKKNIPFILAGVAVATVTSTACLQFFVMEPKQQLPADIFKLHVRVVAEPLKLEVPLLDGSATRLTTPKPVADPQEQFASIIAEYEADLNKPRSFAEHNDYAAALVFSGRLKDAILALNKLEKDHPGEYATASNLGTAYELFGDVENALVWIQKGVLRNPQSHMSTEWLHLAILETKQKLKNDPQWLQAHSVLDGQENHSRSEKELALEYQLNERLNFIRENDPIMCDLFFQAAVISTDPAKKAYFLKQVPRFGSIRDSHMRKLQRGY